jgi:hypothetical protein
MFFKILILSLANKKEVTFDELSHYPYLSYEQKTMNSAYFNEKALTLGHKKKSH